VCPEAAKTASRGKTTTETPQKNRSKERKKLIGKQNKPGNRSFSAACLAPEGMRVKPKRFVETSCPYWLIKILG
jgi:hypothetical protein